MCKGLQVCKDHCVNGSLPVGLFKLCICPVEVLSIVLLTMRIVLYFKPRVQKCSERYSETMHLFKLPFEVHEVSTAQYVKY